MQYKVPKQFASAIIGRGGSVIRDIESKTGTHINMNTNDIESPDTICIIRGNEMEGIRLAESMIKNILDNQPIIETYELFVPLEACGNFGILRRNGNIVQQIQRSSGAKLIIENNAHKTEGMYYFNIFFYNLFIYVCFSINYVPYIFFLIILLIYNFIINFKFSSTY